MPQSLTLPFVLRRSKDEIDFMEITSISETIHGRMRFEDSRLLLQWQLARSTDVVGWEIRTDKELEPVREAELPLSALAGAVLRWRWFKWPPGRYLVLTAADLRAFETISGEAGLKLDHPGELSIRVRRADRDAADELAGELNLAVAERALRAAESARELPRSPAPDESQPHGPVADPSREPAA